MIAKLRIDMSSGLLEVEGSEDFVKSIYEDFKANLAKSPVPVQNPKADHQMDQEKPPASKKKVKAKKPSAANSFPSKTKAKKAPGLVKDLDLSGGTDEPSLKEFFAGYDHKTNYERNLIFTYYLKQVINVDKVTLDHIFTCYRNVNQKIPKALEQSMRDTAKGRGWVDIDNLDDIGVPVAGINHLEHDMKRAEQ